MKKQDTHKKPPKAAKILRKQWKERAFAKKLLKKIAKPADKTFFDSCFSPSTGNGLRLLKEDLGYKEIKRLNALAKSIKANRGWFKPGSIILVAILAGGGTAFGLVAMNPILEHVFENALEGLFQAKADVDGFRFNPVTMRVETSAIRVADRDKPMTNLFEAGTTRIALNPDAVLRGRIHILELRLEGLAFATARTVSGALPEYPEKEKSATQFAEKAELPPLIDFANFDPLALLEKEKNKLATTAAWADAQAAAEEAIPRWEGQINETRQNVEDFMETIQRLRTVDVNKIQTLDELRLLVKDAEESISSGKQLAGDAETIRTGLARDITRIKALEKQARAAVDTDFRYLASFVNPSSGVAMEAFEPLIRNMLTDTGAKYFDTGTRIVELLDRLNAQYGPVAHKAILAAKSGKAGKEEEKTKDTPVTKTREGRTVPFGAAEYPLFRLDLLSSSFTLDNTAWDIKLENISSAPARSTEPVKLFLSNSKGSERIAVQAAIAIADTGAPLFDAEAAIENIPIDFKDSFEALGISSFGGTLSGAISLAANRSGAFTVGMPITLNSISIDGIDGSLAQIVADAIRDIGSVELSTALSRTPSSASSFSLESNIDQIVSNSVQKLALKYADEAKRKLETALRDWVREEFEGSISTAELDSLLGILTQDEASLAKGKAIVDAKKKELEAAIKAKAEGAIKETIKKNVDPALFDKVDGDTLKKIKIPGLK